MNNNNEMIPAVKGQRLKIEKQQLELQQGEVRRELLLLAIEHCGDASVVRLLWSKLDPEEKQNHEILNKFLYYRGGQSHCVIFGHPDLWRTRTTPNDNWPHLPESFTSDRNAFLTFVEKDLLQPIPRTHIRGYHVVQFDGENEDTFHTIPSILCDDKEVMTAVCAKYPLRFIDFSERLKDDEDLLRLALSLCDSSERECIIRFASERLLQKLSLDPLLVPEVDVPENFQASREFIIAFLKEGQTKLKYLAKHVPDDLKNDKDCMLHVIASCNGSLKDVWPGFHSDFLSERLQKDEDIVKALVQEAGYNHRVEILTNAPSLFESREVMMLLLSVKNDGFELLFEDMINQRCPLLDDDDFMMESATRDYETLYFASLRLRSNRDFMYRLVDATQKCTFLRYTTEEFKVQHLDFIVSVINRAMRYDDDDDDNYELLETFGQGFWSNTQAVMACLQKGWPVLLYLPSTFHDADHDSPFLSDMDIVFLGVMNDPSTLKYADSTLKNDREFILRLVQNIDRVLHHAPARMKYDKEIFLTALSRNSGTISDCFDGFKMEDDFDFLCSFALELRTTIATQKSFTKFLGGISVGHPLCPLSILKKLGAGAETDIGVKKKIAEYLGVLFPMGPSLQIRTAALANMELLGY